MDEIEAIDVTKCFLAKVANIHIISWSTEEISVNQVVNELKKNNDRLHKYLMFNTINEIIELKQMELDDGVAKSYENFV